VAAAALGKLFRALASSSAEADGLLSLRGVLSGSLVVVATVAAAG
jgi:hypothetical protein